MSISRPTAHRTAPIRALCRLLLATAALGLLGATPALAAEHWVIVHAGRLMSVPGQPVKTNQTLVIEDGRIRAVLEGFVSPQSAGAPADTEIVDLSRQFVMPGLIDAHVHVQNSRVLGSVAQQRLLTFTLTDADIALKGASNAKIILENGFTSVRNVGAPAGIDIAIKRAINAGDIAGPRMQTAGPTIGPTGTQDDPGKFRPEINAAIHEATPGTVCDGADDCRRAVRAVIKRGNDLVKIKSSGGVEVLTGSPDPRLFDDELRAMVETAHDLGVKVAAHAISSKSIKASLRAGVDSIEHGSQIDDETVALFKKSGAYLVPTLEAPHDWSVAAPTSGRNVTRATADRIWVETKASISRAYRGGVKIAFGTDIGFSPASEEPEEFLYMQEVGMSAVDIIKAATTNAADLMGWTKDVGSLEPGKWADVIATPDSPLNDIRQLLHVSFVMKGGVIYKDVAGKGLARP